MVHPRWATCTQKLRILYYYTIQQNEEIQPASTQLHFIFTLSQSLSHNHRDCFTMLQYNTHMYYNAFLLQGNYHGKIPQVTQYHGSANFWPKNIPKIYFGGFSPETPFLGELPSNPHRGPTSPRTPQPGGWPPRTRKGVMPPCNPLLFQGVQSSWGINIAETKKQIFESGR